MPTVKVRPVKPYYRTPAERIDVLAGVAADLYHRLKTLAYELQVEAEEWSEEEGTRGE